MISISRLLVVGLLVSGVGCHAAPVVEAPAALSFRPTRSGERLWLTTPFAVEITSEQQAREVEAVDATYIGEISVSGGKLRRSTIAQIAAEAGATHFRIVVAGNRLDIVLHRVESDRWAKLPAPLRPASPTASL
jgi:hypothetical protein